MRTNQRLAVSELISEQPITTLAQVFDEAHLLCDAISAIQERLTNEEYWFGQRPDGMIQTVVAEGVALLLPLQRLKQVLDQGHRLSREPGRGHD